MPGQHVRGKLREHSAHIVDQRRTNGEVVDDSFDQLQPGVGTAQQRLGEQILEVKHLDSPLSHHADELVVLPPRPLDPQDIVEQQLVVVCRRQALEAQIRPVDDHLAEAPDLGVDAQVIHAGTSTP